MIKLYKVDMSDGSIQYLPVAEIAKASNITEDEVELRYANIEYHLVPSPTPIPSYLYVRLSFANHFTPLPIEVIVDFYIAYLEQANLLSSVEKFSKLPLECQYRHLQTWIGNEYIRFTDTCCGVECTRNWYMPTLIP